MTTPNREQLLANAVAFLSDPKTRESTLHQRIQFLESKGLTQHEIDAAMGMASSSSQTTFNSPFNTTYAPSMQSTYAFTQPSNDRDWRDYFIMAMVSGSLFYGAVAVARKYLFPYLQPPDQTRFESDMTALNKQFDEIEKRLDAMQKDCDATRQAAEAQRDNVTNLVQEVETTLDAVKDGERKNRDELREIREEVDVIRDMLPKMLEKNKEATNAGLLELQQELKSLKTLLITSNSRVLPSASHNPPVLASRPSIPAWQLETPSTPSASLSKSTDVGQEE